MWGLFAALAAAAASIFVGTRQTKSTNQNIDKQLEAQKAENAANRQYNLWLAKEQNQWNVEQWNRQNEYDSPAAQLQRLREAGLNPDLIYGGGISNTSTSSPQMTGGSPATPMDWSALSGKRTIGDAVQTALQNQLTRAQIDNINADTKKKDGETSILSDEKEFKRALLQGQLDAQNVRIQLDKSSIDVNRQNVVESQSRVNEMNQAIAESDARIQKMRHDVDMDKLNYAINKARNDKELENFASQIGLRASQKKQIDDLIEKMTTAYDDAHAVHVENLGIIKAERGIIEFDSRTHTSNKWDKDIGWYANICKYIDKFTDACDGLIAPAAQVASRSKGGGLTIINQ